MEKEKYPKIYAGNECRKQKNYLDLCNGTQNRGVGEERVICTLRGGQFDNILYNILYSLMDSKRNSKLNYHGEYGIPCINENKQRFLTTSCPQFPMASHQSDYSRTIHDEQKRKPTSI